MWLPLKILWAIFPQGPHTQASSSHSASINHGRFGPDLGQASEKTQAVSHFLFIHPLFSVAVVRTLKRGYRQSSLVFFAKASLLPWSRLTALLTLVYCARSYGFETVLVTLMSAHQRDGSSIALQPVLAPCSQYRHLVVSPLILLPAASQPCSRFRRLTVSIVTLLSASSPCCWSPWNLPHSLAVSLVTLRSVSSPCSQYHHLAVVNIVPKNAP